MSVFPVGSKLPSEVVSGAYLGGSLDVVRVLRSRLAPGEFQPLVPCSTDYRQAFNPVRHVCHSGSASLQREFAKEFPQLLERLLAECNDASLNLHICRVFGSHIKDLGVEIDGEMLLSERSNLYPTEFERFLNNGWLVEALQAPCVHVGPGCLTLLLRRMSQSTVGAAAIAGTMDVF